MYERDGTCWDGSVTKRSPRRESASSLGTPTSSTHRPFTILYIYNYIYIYIYTNIYMYIYMYLYIQI